MDVNGLDYKQMGKRLRAARKARHLTQRALAELAGLRATHLLSYLEHGSRIAVQADTVVRLARALGCTADYLLGLTDDDADDEEAHVA